MPRTPYVAVRNYDYDSYAPQYVAIRRQPVYFETNSKYIPMRNNYVRTRYVAVRGMDDYDYAPAQYVAMRRAPAARYVAVRNVDNGYEYDASPVGFIPVRSSDHDMRPIGYVPIHSSGCECAVSSLENVEAVSPRHVVLKSDYIDGTKEVIYESANYDDTAYTAVASNGHFAYNIGRFHNDGETVLPVSYVNPGNVRYVPASYNSNFDDQAFLDNSDTTYVAVNDVEDACLSPVSVRTLPMRTRAVKYVPTDDVEDYDSVSYVPVSDMENMSSEPVSYAPVENITYMPVRHARVLSYVPSNTVGYTSSNACECPASENRVVTDLGGTDQVVDTSAVVEDNDSDMTVVTDHQTADLTYTQAADDNGYRDGFDDGHRAALKGEEYRPANSSDFRDADNGYDGSFGNKDAYGYTYRNSYLRGYKAGFYSANSSD